MKAYSLIRDAPYYRRQAFELGLKRCGFEVLSRPPISGAAGDVLLIWNRYSSNHDMALQFERQGGTVLVAENGYLSRGGGSPKFDVHPVGPKPHDVYALAKGYHNGAGTWSSGVGRFAELGVPLAPWRTEGDHILICPNRSFGVGEQVMHPDWGQRCADRLRKTTKRRIVVRPHPGNKRPAREVSEDMRGAWAVFVWSSSVAVHALVAGIPTYIEAPYSVVKGASASGPVETPHTPDRTPHLERMAWAQWTCAELETGEPFRRLLEPPVSTGGDRRPPAVTGGLEAV